MMTTKNIELSGKVVRKYLKGLVGRFYKILPIKESGEPSLRKYIDSLQREMLGCVSLIDVLQYDEVFLALLATLQYLAENECGIDVIRCEVFKAINICKKLEKGYSAEEVHP